MNLRYHFKHQILCQFRHLGPVFDVGTKLDLLSRISLTLAVKDAVVIDGLIKEILRMTIFACILSSRCQITLIGSCSCNGPGIHQCHRRNLTILNLRTLPVGEVSGGMANTESIVCRSIACTKARSAEGRLHHSTCGQQISQNSIFRQFHINRCTSRINTQSKGICTDAGTS